MNPLVVISLRSTWRTVGAPSAPAVASAIAFASTTPALSASASHAPALRERVGIEVGVVQGRVLVIGRQALRHAGIVRVHERGTLARCAPGRTRTCASGSGGRHSIH